MDEGKTYTASDLARYHSGQMPPAEMNALEKAALDDPFLADALEGYASTEKPSEDLALLQGKLRERFETNRDRKAFVLPLHWLKVAVVIGLVAGAGWLVMQTASERPGYGDRNAETRKSGSASPAPQNAAVDTVQALARATATDSISRHDDVAVLDRKHAKRMVRKSEEQRPPLAVSMAKATTDNNDRIAENTVGYGVAIQKADSTSSPVASRSKASASVSKLADTIVLDVVLQQEPKSSSEVVVSNPRAKSKSRINRPAETVDSLVPETGWTSFNDYLDENLRVPEDWKEKQASDREVELSFDVDEKGNPVNIRVTKPLCEACDLEAIRLLQDGPKWKGKNKQGKIKINFSR